MSGILPTGEKSSPLWSPFVLSKKTESQLADFTQLFFGQALRARFKSSFVYPISCDAPCEHSD
ncbi:hypothetical protein CO657_25285 (plasmid) [Rhizobium acidisoli]|uniref:Uncharacterized protein n=1 Tax=Rhizobium acidisoli TaxID=1538158 RepID=A0AAE5WRK2_9HYPH|nr:hypothetical protein CO657_25285 [Rhizobium acidisoli]